MAYSEVTVLEIKEFLRLWLAGQPKKRIAALMGRDAKTVRSYIAAALACGLERSDGPAALTDKLLAAVAEKMPPRVGRPRGECWERCAAQREFIRQHIDNGVRLTKVRKLLRRHGVHVSQSTLWRFAVRELGFGRQAATMPVMDCEPGQEVQLDTGWVGRLEPDAGGKRRAQAGARAGGEGGGAGGQAAAQGRGHRRSVRGVREAEKRRTWGTLTGAWVPHDTRDQVVDFVRGLSAKTELATTQLASWIGIGGASTSTGASATARPTSTMRWCRATTGSVASMVFLPVACKDGATGRSLACGRGHAHASAA